MAKKKSSSGGKAEASGSNYETLVAAWYCHCILLGKSTQPPLDLPSTIQLTSLICQSDAPIDDINARTSEDGIVFVQAKRTVNLSTSLTSSFSGALDQFVRQYKACEDKVSGHLWARPLDPARDRLVLATRSESSSKITELLPRLLQGLRDRSDPHRLRDVATSKAEREVALATEQNLQRSWTTAYGKPPKPQQLGALLRLIWVQKLDLEGGKRDRQFVLDQFRINLLEDASQATLAFSELFKLSARLRAERSGTDQPTLPGVLAAAGVRLRALPDYRADVGALKKWTAARLLRAPRFTQLLETEPPIVIERSLWQPFYAAAETQSVLVVGEPGAGKSGLTYRLAVTALADYLDVVFLPVDLLNVDSFSALQNELGITHGLAEILANWPGSRGGLLVIDALDAARKFETQTILRDVVAEILRTKGSRWRVIASVRKYDLRQGTEWARMLRGTPPLQAYSDPEFPRVCHVSVKPLTDDEISQIASSFPALLDLFQQAPEKLRQLLRNIFNLHLLADLLHQGVSGSTLASIRTQPELLDSYWRHRIHREDGKHDTRETTLTTILSDMIAAQSLQVLRSKVRSKIDVEALVDLERNDILRAEDQRGTPNEDVLLFSHHVLFDYAVARLIFGRGRDPSGLVQLLRDQRELSLMLSPSLSLALMDTWVIGGARPSFWDLALSLAQETGLPGVAQLVAPMVTAELSSDIKDLEPVLAALSGTDPKRTAAESFLQNLIGALFVRLKSGVPLIGPTAGPWMKLAERLAKIGNDRVMLALRALLATAIEGI
ncbi:MAG: hypothetical protein ACLQME_13890 [Alphaproteobacteria bacterium]